jgi:hypothetical protein
MFMDLSVLLIISYYLFVKSLNIGYIVLSCYLLCLYP